MTRPLATAAALLFTAGCFTQRTPADAQLIAQWRFAPPRDWVPSRTNEWESANSHGLLSLQVLPAKRPLRAIIDPYFTEYASVKLCRGTPALLGKWRPPFGFTISDEIAMQQPGSIAIATYLYPRRFSADPAAETALRSLCPRERPAS